MLDFIRRLFGAGAAAIPLESPRRTVATVEVEDYGRPGARLIAWDAAETSLLAADVTTGIAPSLGARFDAVWEAVSAPDGDYLVDAVLPARTDETGIALFGAHPMLRLRAVAGGAPRPGRTMLLIHGGPAGRSTDGSIRMGDADLAALLASLPDDPCQVRVRLLRRSRDADDGSDWNDGWTDNWTGDDTEFYYGQLYDWTGTAPDSPPYPDMPAGDEAVGPALAGLGYTVLSDDGGQTAGTGDSGNAGVSPVSGTDLAWSPAGGAYGS